MPAPSQLPHVVLPAHPHNRLYALRSGLPSSCIWLTLTKADTDVQNLGPCC